MQRRTDFPRILLLDRQNEKKTKKKKNKLARTVLSFADDEQGDLVPVKSKKQKTSHEKTSIKNPNIDTSFLPDREREMEERRQREELRQEWLRKQEVMKQETIEITYSYWDGSGHRKMVKVRHRFSIYTLCLII